MSNQRTPRKTVEVSFVLRKANAYLRLSGDDYTEGRTAVAGLVESVLMATNNYEGFGYIKSEFDKHGVYIGHESVRYREDTTDETRRQYYRNPRLDQP